MTETEFVDLCWKRREYQLKIEGDKSFEFEKALCSKDIVHFINQWGYTYAPKDPCKMASGRSMPFLPMQLTPRQTELQLWIQEGIDTGKGGLVGKSRDWGVSWSFVYRAVR